MATLPASPLKAAAEAASVRQARAATGRTLSPPDALVWVALTAELARYAVERADAAAAAIRGHLAAQP